MAVAGCSSRVSLWPRLSSRASNSTVATGAGRNDFGRMVMLYDGIPIEINDFQSDAETMGTDTATSSLYACYCDEAEGIVGLQNGTIEVIPIGQPETKDAFRTRIRWYVAIAVHRDLALGESRASTPRRLVS
jgi:hypothetical protein